MHESEIFSLTNDISQKELKHLAKRLMPSLHKTQTDKKGKECKDLLRLRRIYKKAIDSKNILDTYSENNQNSK
ncbi:MAG: hypothetical protein GY756_15450 [bacterium]|nr:hypothetical protein [bacterium]